MSARVPQISPPGRRGFSFAEVMFAVIILGIGFIMVAALFPVAIQQTKLTVDESAAASIARGAMPIVEQLAGARFEFNRPTPPMLPGPSYAEGPVLVATDLMLAVDVATPIKPPEGVASSVTESIPPMSPGQRYDIRGKVVSLSDLRIYDAPPLAADDYPLRGAMWKALQRGSLISPSDPRFAWVILYKRDRTYRDVRDPLNPVPPQPLLVDHPAILKEDAPAAHVIVIAVQSRERPTFDASDVTQPLGRPVNLLPRPIIVRLIDEAHPTNTSGIDLIQVRDHSRAPGASACVAEGAFVVISDDYLEAATLPNSKRGLLNGMIVRLGAQRGPDTWELVPGNDYTPIKIGAVSLTQVSDAEAYVVGRSFKDPNDSTKGFAGPAMDVAAYSTFMRVK